MNRLATCFGVALLQLLVATGAQAHSTLRSSTPASGSVLTESPAQFTLTFDEPARLTSLVVVTVDGERRLTFAPTGSALTFTVSAPVFTPGRNEVRWKALSADGHVAEGSVIVVLRPARQ